MGVLLQPHWTPWIPGSGEMPTHRTFEGNVVSGLVMRDIGRLGVWARSVLAPDCGELEAEPCRSHNSWSDTTVTGNTIETRWVGIRFDLQNVGDRVERGTVTDNIIRVVGEDTDTGIDFAVAGDSTGGRISDVLIARNSIEGNAEIGIGLGGGAIRAQEGVMEQVRVLDNRLHLVRRGTEFCCQGIVVGAGGDTADFAIGPPVRYLDDNVVRDVLVRGNSVSGTLVWGVSVQAGIGGGGRRNRVENLRIERNTIRSSLVASGVYVWTGDGNPFQNRYATDNRIASVSIDANQIVTGKGRGRHYASHPAGVAILGGGKFGRGNAVSDVRIAKNRIAIPDAGIKLIGGATATARGNSVTCVRVDGNRITGTRKTILVVTNLQGASGNRASLDGC